MVEGLRRTPHAALGGPLVAFVAALSLAAVGLVPGCSSSSPSVPGEDASSSVEASAEASVDAGPSCKGRDDVPADAVHTRTCALWFDGVVRGRFHPGG